MTRYVIGIDLGTTNSVVAYAPLDEEQPQVSLLPIPQLVAAGTVEDRTLLPSFLYLASPHEARGGTLDLPWAAGRDFAVGEMARRQAAEVPDRTLSAAKSWLAHSRVDRREPILPWNAPREVAKISPVEAAKRYLEHLLGAWDAAFPDAPAAEQVVVLTVPASFDASARELTREAALAAGLPEDMILLEEPQAAVYAWLADVGDRWRRRLKLGDRLLVCDVGGGTTDLTLVGVTEEKGDLVLERMAVGNHLLVGGDNMDLAMAHWVAGRLAERGVKLDPWQSVALWHSCRAAKEAVLAPGGKEKHTIAVLGRGSRLIGGTVSLEVGRKEVAELLVDGFFPRVGIDEKPARRRVSGFRELGLPFESDTAVTRHLAAFLCSHGAGPDEPVQPDPRALQRRRVQGRGPAPAAPGGPRQLAPRGRAAPRADGIAGLGSCRRPRRRLLRLEQAPRRHSHPWRHRPGVLRRHRDRRAGRTRGHAAAAGLVRGAHRHGGRERE